MKINVLPATPDTVRQVYGDRVVRSMRAVAFERAGEVLGCAGLYLDGGHLVMFFNGNHDEVRKAPRAIVKAYRALLKIAKERGLAVYAAADEALPATERFLEHMGFRHHDGRVYRWN